MAPAARPALDTVRVEVIGSKNQAGGVLDNFTSLEVRMDVTMPSTASFEIGDDGTWSALGDVFEIGREMRVFINDRPRLQGRVVLNNNPFDCEAGAVVRFEVRTRLADALIASAPQKTRVRDVSIKQFILELFREMQLSESDFIFMQATARNLLTGRPTKTGETPKDLEPIKVEEARVKPPETVYAAADRHLRRHGLMLWDAPDGRIVIGAPNDEQDPTYFFNAYRSYAFGGRPDLNNILSASRTRDWSGVPGALGVYGVGGKRDFTKSRVAGVAIDADVQRAGFYRPVHIIAEGVRTQDLALHTALRELAARSKNKDGFDIRTDGFSYWDGHSPILYAHDTVAQVSSDAAGGTAGPYFVHAVTQQRNAEAGDVTTLEVVKRGIWRL